MAFEQLPFEEVTMTPEEIELATRNFNAWMEFCETYN